MLKWTSGRFDVLSNYCFEFYLTFTWHAVMPRLKEAYRLRFTLCLNRWCYVSVVVLLCR